MSVIKSSTVIGYVEYTRLDPTPSIATVWGYVEWVGGQQKIALTRDSRVNAVTGYIEYTVTDPTQRIGTVMGYVEYTRYDPTPSIATVWGYVEWVGGQQKIALTRDSRVNAVTGYIEYIWDGKIMPETFIVYGPIWQWM